MRLIATNVSGFLSFYPLHQHGCYELIYHSIGKGKEILGSREFRFYPGLISFCPPGLMHGKETEDPREKFQDIYLQFEDDAGIFPSEACQVEDDSNHSLQSILRLLQVLYYDSSVPRLAANTLAETACTLVAHWILGGRKNKITESIRNEIFLHFSDPEFSVMQAMERMNYCPDHIRRVFRQDTGMTPTAFLMQMRLSHAKRLLESSESVYSIRDIASLSGFYDPEYFCRVFHKAYGLSPRDYRNSNKTEKK